MGRKGGGRAGFVKAARSAVHADEESTDQPAAPAVPEAPAPQQPAVSKAAQFLKDVAAPAAGGSSDEDEGEPGVETRGKMLQRHKRVGGRQAGRWQRAGGRPVNGGRSRQTGAAHALEPCR